jgi:hypothetical protein
MKRCRGLSLTELMVATTLLATATAGGLGALSRAQAARRDAATLQQLHERAQYAFATLEPELQMAGYFATGAPPVALDEDGIPEPARRCGGELVRRLDLPVQVMAGWELPCEARGGGALPATSVLVTRRVSARLAESPVNGRGQWLSTTGDAGPGQLFWQGEAQWSPIDAAGGRELRELLVHVFYVARSADGDAALPALRVKSLTSIAGTPAFIDTEVMNGVEDLQVELLPSPSAARALRVRLRVRADPALRAGPPRTLDVTRHFTLRNAPR